MNQLHPLLNWIPYKLLVDKDEVLCRWMYISEKHFTEPFFEETISKCLSYPENSKRFKSVSTLDCLTEASEQLEYTAPSAFIFHVSRCGSTLLSQLLSLDKENIVLSEVPLFDEILRLSYKTGSVPPHEVEEALLAAIRLSGKKRNAGEKRLFIKLDSWHICFYKTIRRLFPSVPFIFLYRSPDEVIRSHQELRGMHAVQGIIEPAVFGFREEEINDLPIDAYLARVLECYFRNFLSIGSQDENSLFINYNEGALSMVQQITKIAGYLLNNNQLSEIQARTQFHSKYPGKPFSEITTKTAIPSYQETAMKLYQQLEEKRILSAQLIP